MNDTGHRGSARRALTGVALLSVALGSAGCPGDGPGPAPPARPRVRVRSFTEASPVRAIAAVGTWAFTASGQGLDRWDLRSGEGLHLDSSHGLPGDRVLALAPDPQRGWVWVATSGGVTRYEIEASSFKVLPPPPKILGIQDLSGVSLETAADGGLWLGHGRGLFYANDAGQWSATGVTTPVTGLVRARDGRLWIGTAKGVIMREPSGETFQYGKADGCDLASVRFVARTPDGGPLLVGTSADGKQRIGLVSGDSCATYRAAPDEPWLAAAAAGTQTILMTKSRLYTLRARGGGARQLTREGMRLVPVKVGDATPPPSPWVIRLIDAPLPDGAVALAGGGDEVFVGTRDVGTARIALNRRAPLRWLRRGELVEEASGLSVACDQRDRCYLATGARWAWRFDGETFHRIGDPDNRVLGFARAKNGAIWGLRHGDKPGEILAARIKQDVWLRTSEVSIETPGADPSITFARFSPSGVLWVGLRYRDQEGEERPYGVALVDTSLGTVIYHHATRDDREVREGVLPIPIDVVAASFMTDDETWLASSEGAARVRSDAVQVFTEGEGLRSELLRGIACSAGGVVFVASGEGVGAFDGEQWTYPRSLRTPVNDIDLDREGRLWMATDRGVAVYDGRRVRRLDQRRGLLEDEILEVAIDQFGRVWLRGDEGVTVITP